VIVTAAQLAHLAELAAFAADYFACSDLNTARTFADTALRAEILSVNLRHDESDARGGVIASVSSEGLLTADLP
jgi:hypothetical protein